MPPKRGRNKFTHIQKKKIQSRLMAISLEMDDYLYQHKPTVPIADAEAYIQEVEEYKAQCAKTDVRTIQVIEKITRYMNAIIKEQKEQIRSPYSTQTNCPSPVYSLPDDDKILCSENPINVPRDEEINKGNIQGFETIDLCDNDNDNAAVHEKVQVEVEIHRAMSGLSITEDPKNEPDYSQSILDNFELNTNVNQNNKLDNIVNELRLKRNNSFSKDNTIFYKEIIEPSPKNPQRDVRSNISKEQNKPSGILKNDNNISNVVFKKPSKLRNNNVEKTKRGKTANKSYNNKENDKGSQRKRTTNKTNKNVCKNNKNNTNKGIDINDSKKVEISNNCDTSKNLARVNETTVHDLNNPETARAKIETLKTNFQATQDFIQVPPSNLISFTPNTNSTEKSAIIYNTSVENDLSWIENMRYVREISNEENDNKLIDLENTFWNNCEFPSNWNNADFDY